jgi:regulator of ribonuclease activity A
MTGMTFVKTADLVDAHDVEVRFCQVQFRQFGRRRAFAGPVSTVWTFEDNALLRRQLETPGNGRVLVIDGGGSTRCAIVGDLIAGLAMDNGWAGLVIYGAIRDSDEVDAMDVGVFAIGCSPKKSRKNAIGAVDEVISFGGIDFVPGHYVYCDADGVLVSERNLIP